MFSCDLHIIYTLHSHIHTSTNLGRGERNSQGGAITATKLVPGGNNLVAVLVPGEPIMGARGKFGVNPLFKEDIFS